MPNELDPAVDQWYSHRDKGETFRVVAVDAGMVEIQNFDGDIEELEMDAWRDMDIDLAEPPENPTGPFDDIEPDDLDYSETSMSPQDWRTSLDSLQPAEEPWQDARAADELDEEGEGRPLEEYLEEDERTRNRLQ